jgi:predicted  nucleic acid-binding Zn-ribbon protein
MGATKKILKTCRICGREYIGYTASKICDLPECRAAVKEQKLQQSNKSRHLSRLAKKIKHNSPLNWEYIERRKNGENISYADVQMEHTLAKIPPIRLEVE